MRRFLAFMMCAVSLGAAGQVPDYVPTDGLMGWWAFDGNAQDQSGNENHGVAYGVEFSHDRFGNANMAATFGIDRWVQIEHSPSIDFVSGDSLTWAIWMKTQPTTAPYGQVIFQKWNGSLGTSYPLSVGCGNQGNLLGSASYCHSDQFLGHEVSTPLDTGQWLHGLMTQTPDSAFMYLNGLLVSASAIDEAGCGNTEPLNIGKKLGSIPAFYMGELDDFGLWNRTLSEAEILGLYNAELQAVGCTDQMACNYNSAATESDESCDYSCCPGPGCCHEGTIWDSNLQQCIVANPSDSNFDGCVQLNDLLDLLTAYGDCGAEDSAWQCGDPLDYQGYDYETVQIGEQCWFAENLRAEKYATGDPIPSSLNQLQWSIATAGASDNYGLRQGVQCQDYSDDPDYDIQTCNPEEALLEYGLLYNAFAMIDSRGLCPTGWIVPADEEWNELEIFLGMDPALAFQIGDRGTAHGAQLRSSYGWRSGANGSDDFGFSVVAGGRTSNGGDYEDAGRNGQFWSTSQRESGEPYWYIRDFQYGVGSVKRYDTGAESGLSIRCIKDAE